MQICQRCNKKAYVLNLNTETKQFICYNCFLKIESLKVDLKYEYDLKFKKEFKQFKQNYNLN